MSGFTWRTEPIRYDPDSPGTDGAIYVQSKTGLVAIVYQPGAKANARLIAAAPDLLEALRRLRQWHKEEYHSSPAIDAAADSAIAKAEGRP